MPCGHAAHAVALETDEYEPAPHEAQADAAAEEYIPAEHRLAQEVDDTLPVDEEYEPAGHAEQLDAADAGWNWPATQLLQLEAPPSENVPGAQLEHAEVPVGRYCPEVQLSEQLVAPTVIELEPEEQETHCTAPPLGWYVPLAQLVQVAEVDAPAIVE